MAELVLFMRETVRELGERRAAGFLKKFYGWYLGRGRFPKPFKQELLLLDSTGGGRAAPARGRAGRARRWSSGSRPRSRPATRSRSSCPISVYGGG